MPLLATMLPLAQPAIAGKSSGAAEPTIPHTVPKTLTEPAHSRIMIIHHIDQRHSTSCILKPKQLHFSNGGDDVFGRFVDILPPMVPLKLHLQKIDSQASDLKAHKLVFKEVVGKLVKKVKELEDKLKGRKRKFVMTESDIEEEEEQDVDPLIKLAKAAATAADDSAVPTGGSNEDDIPPSSSIPSDAFAGGSAIPPDVTTGPTAAPSDKGKSHMLEEDSPVRERTLSDSGRRDIGAEAARRDYMGKNKLMRQEEKRREKQKRH
ncbi:hypothetical protein Tco_1174237 [Tanacetum coccineum]